jgi:hypothetical protein
MTPRQLADEMTSRGYPVTLRQLRDWRERKLLPALTQHGMGRGLGKQCYWEDPGIVERAITVYELLERRERFPGAHYLEMWFAGYPADCNAIRKLLLTELDWTKRDLLDGASDRDEIENALGTISAQMARKMVRNMGTPYANTQALVFEMLNAFVASVLDPEIDAATELVATANAWLSRSRGSQSPSFSINGENLKAVLKRIARYISLDSQSDRISSATDADLDEAHRRWQAVRRVIGLLAVKHYRGEVSEDIAYTGRQFSVVFGWLCIQGLIYLAKRGMGSLVDSKLFEAVNYVTQLSGG